MIILNTTTDKVQVITGSTGSIDVHVAFADMAGSVITAGRQNTAITTATTTDVLAAPASSTARNVGGINIRNKHASTSNAITVQFNDNGTLYELWKGTLLAGEEVQFTPGAGWVSFDTAGGIKQAGLSGRYLKTTVLSSGTTFTTGPSTNTIKIRVLAGGGQGGGCTIGSASISGAAGGGAAGGYAEKTFAVAPNTAYTYAIGQGGTTTTAGASTGQAGTNSTFAVGGVTVTANGGPGGLGSTSAAAVTALGGAPPAVSTNGDVNSSGDGGEAGFVSAVGIAVSGNGGTSPFGAGGSGLRTQGTGGSAASIGAGGGGGGGCAIGAVAAVAGGAGSNGLIIVEEYA